MELFQDEAELGILANYQSLFYEEGTLRHGREVLSIVDKTICHGDDHDRGCWVIKYPKKESYHINFRILVKGMGFDKQYYIAHLEKVKACSRLQKTVAWRGYGSGGP